MRKIVALAGGVGGAKLALGFNRLGPETDLTIIGNTGDDLDLFGLRICPDLDTLLYTLAGLANPETGWGLQGDTFNTLGMLKQYGEDTWFWLGDRDFGTHLFRTQLLRAGKSLTEITRQLTQAQGLNCQLLPMCDEDVRTVVQTEEAGELPFQEYFVRRQARDRVKGLIFVGAEKARVTPQVTWALGEANLIVLCPSNPYLSISPILAVPGLKTGLREAGAPIVVVSPIVGGKALKGPAAEIMRTMGGEEVPSALGVARFYQGWTQGFVLDHLDNDQKEEIKNLGFKTLVTNTIMLTIEDKARLAAEIVEFFA